MIMALRLSRLAATVWASSHPRVKVNLIGLDFVCIFLLCGWNTGSKNLKVVKMLYFPYLICLYVIL